jgi:CubicO group peptidase (beta-lactamase class C family)
MTISTLVARLAALTLGLILGWDSAALAADSAESVPPPAPVDYAAAFAGFDAEMEQALRDWEVPGLALGVVKDGQLVYSRGYGQRDVGAGLPVTTQTVFPIGSITKSFTVALLAQLADEGKLDWDAPVKQYLPGFELKDEYAADHVTLRDMCSHRTGMPRHDPVWFGTPYTRGQLVERLRWLDFSTELREQWQYNNLMFLTAGYVAEQASGQGWNELMQLRILDPLGMAGSTLDVPHMQAGTDYARGYMVQQQEGQPAQGGTLFNEIGHIDFPSAAPAGALNSNIDDMAKYVAMQLEGGCCDAGQIISPAQLAQMHTIQMAIPAPVADERYPLMGYGLGWFIRPYRGHYSVSHGGNIGGFSANVMLLPKQHAGIIVLTNMMATPLTDIASLMAADRVLGIEHLDWSGERLARRRAHEASQQAGEASGATDRRSGTQPSHPLEEYAGTYAHPAYGEISVLHGKDGLQFTVNGITVALDHYHYDIFTAGEGPDALAEVLMGLRAQFATDIQGYITSVAIPLEPAVDPIVFTKKVESPATDTTFTAAIVGDYKVGNTIATISLRGDVLILTVPGQPVYELEPLAGGEFRLKGLSGYTIRFVIDAAGGPTKAQLVQPDGTYEAVRTN